eukprot:jgi/Mesvir1/24706/Mv21986-RA.1
MKKVEAKKKRHIYSSGLAGCGGKGEELPKKNAGEEVKCPYCDRIYKQDGRLKDHIKNKHAAEQAAPEGGAPEATKGAEATPVKSTPTNAIPAKATSTNATPAKATPSKGSPATGMPAGTPGGPPAGMAPEQPKYFQKTPRHFLQEYCQKNRMANPKFKQVEVDGGFHCRVVLHNNRDTDDDVILWCRDTKPTSEEATQHAALLALHHLAHGLNMVRLLPAQYRPAWNELDAEAEKKARQQRAREAQEAQRRRSQARQQDAHDLYMSEANQRLLEDAIKAASASSSSSIPGGKEDRPASSSQQGREAVTSASREAKEVDRELASLLDALDMDGEGEGMGAGVAGAKGGGQGPSGRGGASGLQGDVGRKLLGMGFQAAHVEEALAAGASTVDTALEWLMLHVDGSLLPQKFVLDKSGAGVSLEVIRRKVTSAMTSASATTTPSAAAAHPTKVAQRAQKATGPVQRLMQCGYPQPDAASALQQTGDDEQAALCQLFQDHILRVMDPPCDPATASHGEDGQSLAELRAEERLVMESIYGDGFSVLSEDRAQLKLSVPGLPGETTLVLVTPPGSHYPLQVPVLAVSNGSAPPGLLLWITKGLADRARQLAGAPMLHELAETALPDLVTQHASGAAGSTPFAASSELAGVPADGILADTKAVAGSVRGGRDEDKGSRDAAVEGEDTEDDQGAPGRHQEQNHRRRGGKGGRDERVREAHSGVVDGTQATRGGQQKREEDPAFVGEESRRLLAALEAWRREPKQGDMRKYRENLPAYGSRARVIQLVKDNTVVVVCGMTGCGKSTQVPQYILEAMTEAGDGGRCNIICTQPRRISAIGVAERVASERGEPVGNTVGYSIRMEARRSRHTRLLFCTTGILLRTLLSNPTLEGISHVFVDEVHERSLDSDLLLLLLRALILRNAHSGSSHKEQGHQGHPYQQEHQQRQGNGAKQDSHGAPPRLRLVLMSATVDSALFAGYFRGVSCQVIDIPGRTFPVKEFFLDDVFERTGIQIGRSSKYAARRKNAPEAQWRPTVARATVQDGKAEAGKGGPAQPQPQQAAAGEGKEGADEEDEGENDEAAWDSSNLAIENDATAGSEADPLKTSSDELPEEWEHALLPGVGSNKSMASGPQAGRQASAESATRHSERPGSAKSSRDVGEARDGAAGRPVSALSQDVYSEATLASLKNVDEEILNPELIEAVVFHIISQERQPSGSLEPLCDDWDPIGKKGTQPGLPGGQGAGGAILVFLPGMAEINKVMAVLQASQRLSAAGGAGGGLWVLPLHGSLSSAEQRRVFQKPSRGMRKVLLATNVAETSITIDDVVYVIDSGRVNEMRFDSVRGMSVLTNTWVSRASADQRRGRAGRVKPGCCIHLYSKATYRRFESHQQPEMLRVSLENLCLQVKSILPGRIEANLGQALSPPSAESVGTAVRRLVQISALDAEQNLTPLGQHLVNMPVDVSLGKMLLFGAIMRCMDPVLTIAASMCDRSPFLAPFDKRAEVKAARMAIAGQCHKSDHLAVVVAYNRWLAAKAQGRQAEMQYCNDNFLSSQSLHQMQATKMDLVETLIDMGFLPRSYRQKLMGRESSLAHQLQTSQPAGYRGTSPTPSGAGGGRPSSSGASMDASVGEASADGNAGNSRLVKAVLCAGLYPNIIQVKNPEKVYKQTETGAVEKESGGNKPSQLFTRDDGRVFLHPSSINFHVNRFETPWLAYSEKVKTSKVFVREATMLPAYALMVFGGTLEAVHEKGQVTIDGWIRLETSTKVTVLVKKLRAEVNKQLADKLSQPDKDLSESSIVKALVQLLTTDGL